MLRFRKAPRHKFGGAFFILALLLCPFAESKALTPFQITLSGWQNEFVRHAQSPFHIEENEIVVPVQSSLIQGKLEGSLNLQPENSELVVFIPGTYGGRDSIDIVRFAEELFGEGYSTLRLSNPLSTYFVEAQTRFPGLDFKSEADLYLDLVKQLQNEHSFSRVHFFGVSYGALVAAVMANNYGPAFNGRLILFSPPKNIRTSLAIIDNYFDELKDEAAVMPWDHIFAMLDLQWKIYWHQPLQMEPKLAKSLLFLSGFHRSFREVVTKMDDFKATSLSEKFWVWRESFQSEQLSLRFIPFVRKINPAFFERPEHQEIHFWLKNLPGRWEIFTSSDDYINAPDVKWPKNPHIHVYENGGHIFGIMSRPGFIENIGIYLK